MGTVSLPVGCDVGAVEVPGARGDLALLVVVGAGQRGFHSGQADDVVAVSQRVAERDYGAKIVSHYRQRPSMPSSLWTRW